MAKILVIDDNADLLQMMRLILQERGRHEVILSADGADGLSRALASPPDLAIVDVMMPGITGYDVVRRLREQPQTAGVRILVLTARGQMIDRQTALKAGADDHMAKPVTPKVLLDKVEELLAARKVARARDIRSKVVSLISLRGGVGVTTLAVNTALAAFHCGATGEDKPRVCLVDLCPSSGHGALHLRVKAEKTWADLPELANNPSPEALLGLLTPHPSGLRLLAAPFEPTFGGLLSATIVTTALDNLSNLFDLVVVDTPSLIDVVAAATLDNSSDVILVLTPEIGAIQSSVAALKVMDDVRDRVRLVLNQVCPEPSVPDAVVEKALRRPVSLRIPFDPAQANALAQGKPLAWANPSSPLALASQQLLEMMGYRTVPGQ